MTDEVAVASSFVQFSFTRNNREQLVNEKIELELGYETKMNTKKDMKDAFRCSYEYT